MRCLGAPLRRPVATGAAYVALFALGLAAIPGLPLSLAPDLDFPRLTVQTTWPNASPEAMEALVTSPIEALLSSLPGLEEIASNSGPGWGWVDVSFRRGTRMDIVEVLVRERLAAERESLPDDLPPPVVTRTVPEEIDPGQFFVLQLVGPRTPEALRAVLDDRVLPALASVAGVSGTNAYGGALPEIRIEVPRNVVERGVVSAQDLERTLDRVGPGQAAGSWRRAGREIPIVMSREDPTARAVREGTIARDDLWLSVGDVARVIETWEEPRRLARLDGHPSVQASLDRSAGTNVMRVAAAVRERLDGIRSTLPEDLDLRIVHDQSDTIREELGVLGRRASVSVLLILAVLLAARRGFRPALVILSSVLLSALATFLMFRFAGVGLNLITLSGLALAFGMAVDNSIVLLENVGLRLRGKKNRVRTLAAIREVLFPLLAATATTAVVTMPFLYLEADLRDSYLPFVLAVVLSLVASLGVALTWTPLLAPWAIGTGSRKPRSLDADPLRRGFRSSLDGLLRRPWIPVLASAVLLSGSLWVFSAKVSKGSIFSSEPTTTLRVVIGQPPGATIDQSDHMLRKFEDHVLGHEFAANGWLEQVQAFVTEQRGYLTVDFPRALGSTTVPAALKDELAALAATMSGANISVTGEGPGFNQSASETSPTYQIRVSGPDWNRLDELTDGVGALLARNRRIRDIDLNGAGLFVDEAIEIALIPDRARIAAAGLTMTEFVDAVSPAISLDLGSRRWSGPNGEITGRVRFRGGESLRVVDLEELLIPTPTGARVPLGNLARLEDRGVPGEIRRRDQQYERAINFDYRGPRRVGDRFVRSVVENTAMPPGYELEDGLGFFLSSSEETQIQRGIALAILLILLVSAALFESLVLPFVAVLSIPLSFVAIPFTFWATGESFDRTAYVGLILLAGIAINNALLLVHRAGKLHRRTGDARAAAMRAAEERVRPILLTTATSVAGLLPLIWEGTSGVATTWRSLSLAATAGLVASAAFTLFVIPCLFTMIASRIRPTSAATVPLRTLRGESA